MADILDAAQTNNQPAGQSPLGGAPPEPPPVPPISDTPTPPPPPPPVSDNLVIPPPEEVKPPEPPKETEPPKEDQPKKKLSPVVIITGIILLFITLPFAWYVVQHSEEIRSQAAGTGGHISHNPPAANEPAANEDGANEDGAKGGSGTGDAVATFGYNYDTEQKAKPTDWTNMTANIAGTYVSGNKRYVVGVPASLAAAAQYNIANGGVLQGKIANLSAPATITSKASCLAAGGQDAWVSEPGGECGPGGYRNECKVSGRWYFVNCDNTNKTKEPKEKPTPPSPKCLSLVAYKGGHALSASALSKLKPGDVITLTLTLTPSGTATKVRFRVNSGNWNVSTTKNAKKQFVWNYKLANTKNFNIVAQWYNGSWH